MQKLSGLLFWPTLCTVTKALLYLCGLFLCSQVRFSEDIGELYKVRLGFDDDNDAEQNWLLDTVKINSIATVSELTL